MEENETVNDELKLIIFKLGKEEYVRCRVATST